MVQLDVDGSGGINLEEMLRRLSQLVDHQALFPDEDTEVGRTTRTFLDNSWAEARDDLLARTDRIRVEPLQSGQAPFEFRFEVDRPYKSQRPDGVVELVEGPIRGTIRYRPDLFTAPAHEPSIVVLLDRNQRFFHGNYSRSHGILCIGGIPTGPFPLQGLLLHVYSILTYENWSALDPADREAARYFATNPEAMAGLELVEPLY